MAVYGILEFKFGGLASYSVGQIEIKVIAGELVVTMPVLGNIETRATEYSVG